MPIVSSAHVVGHAQVDGRVYVRETHTDDIGALIKVEYLIAAGADYVAIRTARAARLNVELADAEALATGDIDSTVVLRHQTKAEFAARVWARLRDAFAGGDKLTYHRLVWWFWARLQVGDFTSDQARVSFNSAFDRTLNAAQWTALVTARLVPMKDRYLALLAEGAL